VHLLVGGADRGGDDRVVRGQRAWASISTRQVSASACTCAAIAAATAPSTVRGACRWLSGSPAIAASTRYPAPQFPLLVQRQEQGLLSVEVQVRGALGHPGPTATSAIVVA
jgi:hypothetical protein